jgi:hypothetical protein
MGYALRWLVFAPTAIFMGFVMLVEINNVADWLSSDFPVVALRWPAAYVLADLIWPIVFVLVAAFVAPAGRIAIAVIFALLACGLAVAAGGSLSLYWVAQTPDSYHKIGLGATVLGSLLGVMFVGLILRWQAEAPRTAPA